MDTSHPDESQKPKTWRQDFAAALQEHAFRAELIIYSLLLVVGVIQIIIRERFPQLHPPWKLIGVALIIVLFAVLFVPPVLLVMRTRRNAGSEEPHAPRRDPPITAHGARRRDNAAR